MKNILHSFLLVLIICAPCFSQEAKIKSIKIECAGLAIETAHSINCSEFKQSFRDEVKSKIIINYWEIKKFTLLMNQFEEEGTRPSFDVRGILTLVYSNKKEVEYCFDKFGNFQLNGKFFKSKNLLSYISDQLYSKHSKHSIK